MRRLFVFVEETIDRGTRWAVFEPNGASGYNALMGRLARRVLEGDEVIAEWSASEPGSYEAAAELFRRELESGYSAVRVEGAEHEPVTELPEDADLVLLTTAMGGG